VNPERAPNPADERPADTLLEDLLHSLAAIGWPSQEEFSPRGFLAEFSARIARRIPHDRLVIDLLDEDGQTFTVLAEHAAQDLTLHQEFYTTAFAPQGHYVAAEWVLRGVFAGGALRVDDLATDPRFCAANPFERRVQEAGLRSALLVPLRNGARVIGALVATSLVAGAYTENQLATLRQIANLIGPFIESLVLFYRERRRRRRLRALQGLTRALGASLNVGDVFARLAEAVRPVLDFDVMGAALLTPNGRDVEVLGMVDHDPTGAPTPRRIPLQDFSFGERIEAGETVLIHDAPVELDPSRPGDRLIIKDAGRSCLVVPMLFGERVGGGLHFGKRRPQWYDRLDAEVAAAVAAQVVLAVQHQQLAEERRRLAAVEVRAKHLEQRVATLRDALGDRYGFDQIIGRASNLREALDRAAKVAPTEATALLTGESGTGKELVARAIHQASLRAEGLFVAINCAALADTLLESELFGHERGAFTGADRMKPGRFELAAGGTLFLDEVGELSPSVQAKLLRVLQEREFQRVGGTVTLHADVRLIAATNKDLVKEGEAGRFRDDLYYRLNVFAVHLPPLRERGEDVLLLADHFVRTLAARMAKADVGLSRDAREALLGHNWPGNIRELQNAVERALIVSEGGLLTAAHFGIAPRKERPPRAAEVAPSDSSPLELEGSLPKVEKRMVSETLKKAKGNKSKAAATLGLTRSQLYTRLKRHGIEL
jgi:transcriptional regulator with GAF, ATPase, and Fis domain